MVTLLPQPELVKQVNKNPFDVGLVLEQWFDQLGLNHDEIYLVTNTVVGSFFFTANPDLMGRMQALDRPTTVVRGETALFTAAGFTGDAIIASDGHQHDVDHQQFARMLSNRNLAVLRPKFVEDCKQWLEEHVGLPIGRLQAHRLSAKMFLRILGIEPDEKLTKATIVMMLALQARLKRDTAFPRVLLLTRMNPAYKLLTLPEDMWTWGKMMNYWRLLQQYEVDPDGLLAKLQQADYAGKTLVKQLTHLVAATTTYSSTVQTMLTAVALGETKMVWDLSEPELGKVFEEWLASLPIGTPYVSRTITATTTFQVGKTDIELPPGRYFLLLQVAARKTPAAMFNLGAFACLGRNIVLTHGAILFTAIKNGGYQVESSTAQFDHRMDGGVVRPQNTVTLHTQ